ncbi:MAG: hypothetical protein LJE62_05830 [Silicimonas sp.]|nr:hypothetical protein [Silicimonas sp.]
MLPAASSAGVAIKTAQPVVLQSAARTAQANAPETPRASAGEAAASNIPLETAKAVTSPEQSAVAPRLRDQENAEQSNRADLRKDVPTGPPPAFDESPLERQARLAFDPPEHPVEGPSRDSASIEAGDAPEDVESDAGYTIEPPPTRSERAEASFAETRNLALSRELSTVDVGY